ncbi:hypothetical protein GQ600_22879 [Phytophthora cactorum]|nr:hypothetical protein GQ600_22879 [Phytophthora cactorum]
MATNRSQAKRRRLLVAAASVGDALDVEMAEEAPAVGAAQQWVDSTTMKFPEGLPLEKVYSQSDIYVRDCYPQYYKRITGMLEGRKTGRTTVTGMPGKTALRERLATIITASLEKNGKMPTMKAVVVWRNKKPVHEVGTDLSMRRACLKAENDAPNDMIYLYDGPPQELQTAAEVLALQINSRDSEDMPMVADLVQKRFHVFGGDAHQCLSKKAECVRSCEKNTADILKKFEEMGQIQRVLDGEEGVMSFHYICHYIPDPMNPIITQLRSHPKETYLNIEKSIGMRSFGSDFSAADLVSDKYHVPTKENFVSIDSFYYSTSTPQLLLFK